MPSTRTPPTEPRPNEAPEPLENPFKNSTSLLEIIPQGIDIEEEARLYDELCDSPVTASSVIDLPLPTSTDKPRPRHRSRPSSLFSAEPSIWLSDNTAPGSPGAAPTTFARDVRIAGWTLVGDKQPSSGGAYIVYDCALTLRDGSVVHAHKRYSAFAELDRLLRASLPPPLRAAVPRLPPKNPLARYRAAFLDRRRRELQHWLASVVLHPDLGGCEVVRRWVVESS